MNTQQCIKEIKQKLMKKFDIDDCFAKDKLFFMQHSKNKMLVGVEQSDYSIQDKYFFLFDSAQILNSQDDFYGPVAMIKFMPNQKKKGEMFIRRLEFINDSCRGKGYASCLIKLFESYCQKNDYKNISGEMIPLHDVSEDVVENYYRRNGFDIVQQDGQKMIDKKVEKPVQTTIEGVTLVKNEHYESSKLNKHSKNVDLQC